MRRFGCWVLAATVWGWPGPVTRAAEDRLDKAPRVTGPVLEPSRLLRLSSASRLTANGEPMQEVSLDPLDGAPRVTYLVPNLPSPQDENTFNPPPEVMRVLEKPGIGAVVQVKLTAGEYGVALVGMKPVPYLPGEDTPHGYVFVRKSTIAYDRKDYVQVHVTKFGRPSTFIVPQRDGEGETGPDAAITAALATAKAGTLLEVTTEEGQQIAAQPVIRHLWEYRPTETGRFLGLDEEADGRANVQIEVGDATVKLAVPAPGPETRLLNHDVLASLVTGRTVRFTTTSDEVKALRSIELEGSLRKSPRGEYLLTFGTQVFEVYGVGTKDVRVSSREQRRELDSPGAAVFADSQLQNLLLLEPVQSERLKRIEPREIKIDHEALGRAVAAAATAADPKLRFEAEQKAYDLLQDHAARLDTVRREIDQEVREILTTDQYEVASRATRRRGGMFIHQ